MANELTVVELYGQNGDGCPVSYTCASGTAIAKGTLLTLTDPYTVAANAANKAPIAGVASMDKSGTDFSTKISVWTDGVFNGKASGAILIGEGLASAGGTPAFVNYIMSSGGFAVTAASGAAILGYARDAAAASETFNVRLKL
jgi:hypothetical protein